MKKLLILFMGMVLFTGTANATVGWNKTLPQSSENPQAISPDVIENNTAVDLMLQNYRDGGVYVKLISTSEIDIGPGGVMLSNSGGSTRLMVANSSLTAMSSTNIDTGSISPSSTYYIYAYASSTTATTFSVIYSASSSAPTGITYYQQIGKFTTDVSSNFSSSISSISAGTFSVYNYGTSQTTGVGQVSTLKISYGTVTPPGSQTIPISNLPFTSNTSYSCTCSVNVTNPDGEICTTVQNTGSGMTIYGPNTTQPINWICIGT